MQPGKNTFIRVYTFVYKIHFSIEAVEQRTNIAFMQLR